MSAWHPILDMCVDNGYQYAAISPESFAISKIINNHNFSRSGTKWMTGKQEDKVFFIRHGDPKEFFERGHPIHAEDGAMRGLVFNLGYVAPTGTPLPNHEELQKIEATIPSEIERMRLEFHRAGAKVAGATPTNFEFSGTRNHSNDWDKAISSIESGHTTTVHMDVGGKLTEVKATVTGKVTREEIGNIASRAKSSYERIMRDGKLMGSKGLLIGGAVVAVGAVIYGVKSYMGRGKSDQQASAQR